MSHQKGVNDPNSHSEIAKRANAYFRIHTALMLVLIIGMGVVVERVLSLKDVREDLDKELSISINPQEASMTLTASGICKHPGLPDTLVEIQTVCVAGESFKDCMRRHNASLQDAKDACEKTGGTWCDT